MSALRGYQAEGVEAVYAGWRRDVQRVGVSLPTGTGKTHMMAHVARREVLAEVATSIGHGRPVLFLLHRDTLVEQTVSKLRLTLPPGTSVGVLKAERNEVAARVVVASVHSLRTEFRRRMLPRVGVCVVDEAHVSVSPTYLAVFRHIGAFEPDGARLVGFSATWSRSDRTGLGDVWQEIVYQRTIRWAVQGGHLVRPRGIQVGEGVDLDRVPVSRATGDYREADLGAAVMLEELRDTVVRGALRFAADRPGVLFAPTVTSAEYFAEALTEAGLRTVGIYHDTSPAERRRRFADHLPGGPVRILSTCSALAEGWDSPHTSALHMLRPTRHEGTFVQITGRTLRPWPGKVDALVLDYVGVLDDLDLRASVDLRETPPRVVGDGDLVYLDEPPTDEPEDDDGDGVTVRRRKFSREVELFAGTKVAWQTTPDGVPFVACGDRLVFVVPTPAGWSVGECASYTHLGGRWLTEHLDAQDALDLAVDHAEATGRALSARAAAWRRRPPSAAMVGLAASLGIEHAGRTQGELSAAIDMATASRTLRPLAQWSQQEMNREMEHAHG